MITRFHSAFKTSELKQRAVFEGWVLKKSLYNL